MVIIIVEVKGKIDYITFIGVMDNDIYVKQWIYHIKKSVKSERIDRNYIMWRKICFISEKP